MNRAQALAAAFALPSIGPRVILQRGPEPADILVSGESYTCRFEAPAPGATDREIRTWADWTAKTRAEVAEVWPTIAHLPPPPPEEIAPSPVTIPEPPPLAHAYPIGPLVPDSVVHAYQTASREGELAVTRTPYPGPVVGWHEWGTVQAMLAGASKPWAGLAPLATLPDDHPARPHVRTLLVRAAESEPLPRGIVALDLAGLPLSIVLSITRALRAREDGVIVAVKDAHALLTIARDPCTST